MNEIQQNAIDLCAGLREMKWKAFEQQLLTPPDEDNFACAPPSDLPHIAETDEQRLQRLEEDARLLNPTTHAAPDPVDHLASLFADDDTSHLPKQIRDQLAIITRIYGEFNV